MNGPHDMGGMQCYGPVIAEENEPIFHDEWEARALALTVACGFCGLWNIDISRHSRESLPPDFYLTKTYYQIWIAGLEKLMLERGMVTKDELKTGKSDRPPVAVKRVVTAEEMPASLAAGAPAERKSDSKPGFEVGDAVRTLNINPQGHTRLPRYARAKSGRIALVHGFHVFPDSNAAGDGEQPQWLYGVEFDAVELFGQDSEANSTVMVDCWESYLAAD